MELRKATWLLTVLTIIPIVLSYTYTITAPGKRVTIDIDDLDKSVIKVETKNSYVPFYLTIKDVPKGVYKLEIPEDKTDILLCAPTFFNVTSSGEDLDITCIAAPKPDVVSVVLKRIYNGSTTRYRFSFEIYTKKEWYLVWSGGIDSGYAITNGEYTIEHHPRELVSRIIVKKGNEVVWAGIMFPGQEENITDDLKIKFLGALDNVTYIKVFSTSPEKFSLIQQKPQVIVKEKYIVKYVYPKCYLENGWIVIENANATLIYKDGTNETISAINETIKVKRPDVVEVICGTVLKLQEAKPQVQQPPKTTETKEEEKQEEVPRFITPPRTTYYVGETVSIVANKEFEISCTDGTHEITRVFTRVFNEPVSCTVVLGDKIRTFSVIPKRTTTPQHVSYEQPKTDYTRIIIFIIVVLLAYLLYRKYKEGGLTLPFLRKKTEGGGGSEEVEYRVVSAAQGEH